MLRQPVAVAAGDQDDLVMTADQVRNQCGISHVHRGGLEALRRQRSKTRFVPAGSRDRIAGNVTIGEGRQQVSAECSGRAEDQDRALRHGRGG